MSIFRNGGAQGPSGERGISYKSILCYIPQLQVPGHVEGHLWLWEYGVFLHAAVDPHTAGESHGQLSKVRSLLRLFHFGSQVGAPGCDFNSCHDVQGSPPLPRTEFLTRQSSKRCLLDYYVLLQASYTVSLSLLDAEQYIYIYTYIYTYIEVVLWRFQNGRNRGHSRTAYKMILSMLNAIHKCCWFVPPPLLFNVGVCGSEQIWWHAMLCS